MRVLVLVLNLLLLGGCSNSFCTNETVTSLASPGGKHQATLFMRECGATTDFTTQVSVDPMFYQFTGNTFVADGYNGGTRGSWGGPWAKVKWIGPDELLITYDGQARVFTRNTEAQGVRISYLPVRR